MKARYGVVIERDGTFECDALEGILAYIRRSYHYVDVTGDTDAAVRYFAALAKEHYNIDVDTSTYRRFLETMPPQLVAFYEDPTFPRSELSELE